MSIDTAPAPAPQVSIGLIRRGGLTRVGFENQFVAVRTTPVLFPDGSVGEHSDITTGTGQGVVIVPLMHAAGTAHLGLAIQHRWAAQEHTIEFPRGGVDPGEEPLQAAYRELSEETGIPASSVLAHLDAGTIRPDAGMLTNQISVHLMVIDPREAGHQYVEPDTGLRFRWSPLADVHDMIACGALSCSITMSAYLLSQARHPGLFHRSGAHPIEPHTSWA